MRRKINLTVNISSIKEGIENVNNKLNTFVQQANKPVVLNVDTANINKAITQSSEVIRGFACQAVRDIANIGLALNPLKGMINGLKNSMQGFVTASNIQEKATQSLVSAMNVQNIATQQNIKRFEKFTNTMSRLLFLEYLIIGYI
jgi:methyl-accepting chemotaxis protein